MRLAAPRWSLEPHSEGHHSGPMGVVCGGSPGSARLTSSRPANKLPCATRRNFMGVTPCTRVGFGERGQALQDAASVALLQAATGAAQEKPIPSVSHKTPVAVAPAGSTIERESL